MNIISKLVDLRINSSNLLIEMTIKEYLELSKPIIKHNEYQRKRVKGSTTVYSLLKKDIEAGCILPPIVLALTSETLNTDITFETLKSFLDNLLILDGLQRTFSIIELEREISQSKDDERLKNLLNKPIRIELYLNLNRLGILYRMLTLNTGQTPMSLRHQIEILYLDLKRKSIDDITFVREVDSRSPVRISEYNFKEVVEGFNSYLERNELPLSRLDLLDNIKGLEKLAIEAQDSELFEDFLRTFHSFVLVFDKLCESAEIDDDWIEENGTPFGKNPLKLFKKSQAMTGFGAAIGKMKDYKLIENYNEVNNIILQMKTDKSGIEVVKEFNIYINHIRLSASKIGNAQRMFFHYYFRELFNKQGDTFGNIFSSIESAYKKYRSQI